MSFVKVLLSVQDSAATMKDRLQLLATPNQFDDVELVKLVGDVVDGTLAAYAKVSTGSVRATATITFSSTGPVAEETLSIANVSFTAKASGATGNEFDRSNTPSVDATNLAAAINASTDLAGIVTASASSAVVTLTAVQPGKSGNGLQLSENMTNTAAVAFANGSDGDQVTANYGAAS